MRRSTHRIRVSHAGTLPRPASTQDLSAAVKEVVYKQLQVGIDIVNDGELSKSNFTNYVRERLQVRPTSAVGRTSRRHPTRCGGDIV
jgi:5-methyltetrahydropteroyltriglutamate--homocysteine methyltransferase